MNLRQIATATIALSSLVVSADRAPVRAKVRSNRDSTFNFRTCTIRSRPIRR